MATSESSGDPWSRYMLAFLNSVRGNTNVANQIYAPLQQMAPNLMAFPSAAPPPGASGQPGANWIKTVGETADMLTKVFGTTSGPLMLTSRLYFP